MHQQRLYISTILAARAIRNNSELDCLAFGVMCKLMFGASVIKKSTARGYKAMFRMGLKRLNRIMAYCIERGYLIDEGSVYRVAPIKEARVQNMLVELPRVWGKTSSKRSAVTLNEIKDYIRKVVAYEKFSKKDAIENALKAKANPKSLSAYRKAQKLYSRISHNSVLEGKLRGTSMSRVASNMNTSKGKARRLMKQMVADGWMTCAPVTIRTNFKPEQFSEYALRLTKQMGWHGSYFCLGREIFCRVANIYRMQGDSKLRFLRSI